jgi:hypothetical protein
MIGTSDVDNIVSLPVLVSLCVLCRALRPERSQKDVLWSYALAGFLLGAAAGLKWTCFVYAAGMTVTLLLLWRLLRLNWRIFGAFAAGGVAGFLPTGGYWSWLLWSRYGNPVLPYWNDVFRSLWMPQSDFRDMRFPPESAEHALTYAFQFFIGGELHPTSEGPLRDARFAILSLLVPLALAAAIGSALARRARDTSAQPERLVPKRYFWLILTFTVVSYALWLRVFAIHRYLAPVTFLTALVILCCTDFLFSSRGAAVAAFLTLATFSVYWVQVDLAGWRVPYGSDWFGVRLPPAAQEQDTLFIMLGGGPVSHIVPYLPESARAVRLTGSTVPQDGTETEVARQARAVIQSHGGTMRSLSIQALGPADYAYLERFGLVMDETNCVQFASDTDRFTTCPIFKTDDPRFQASEDRGP